MELSDRKKLILKAVIETYIDRAEPVGSKTLAEEYGLNISSATIRNEMSDLEELGYLEQPHISAGRVPSHTGYRFYVNELMKRKPLTPEERHEIDRALNLRVAEIDRLTFEVSKLVAALTQCTSYALSPNLDKLSIRRFDIIPVDGYNLVIVLVTDTGVVKNRVLKLRRLVENQDVTLLTGALNLYLTGIEVDTIPLSRIRLVETSCRAGAFLMPDIVAFISEVYDEMCDRSVHVGGTTKLFAQPEYRDSAKAERVLDFLSDARQLAGLEPQENGVEVRITIGTENKIDELSDSSMFVTRYQFGDKASGMIGLIGPTRMDYAKISARLSYFARGLNRLINETLLGDDDG